MSTNARAPLLPADAVIHARGLVKTFDRGRTRALDGADLDVSEGEFVAVSGPSGSGKSTLLHLFAALDVPDEGRLVVCGLDLRGSFDRDRYRAATTGIVFQLDHLLPQLTVAENVEAALVGAGIPRRERHRRVADVIEEVGLTGLDRRRPSTLSGGERQRVAIARAVATDPAILLADEPTGRLDQANGQNVLRLIDALRRRRNLTVLLVTHDPAIARLADRRLVLTDGRIAPPGVPADCSSCGLYRARGTRFCGQCGREVGTTTKATEGSPTAGNLR